MMTEKQQIEFWKLWQNKGASTATFKLQDGAYIATFWSDDSKIVGTGTIEVSCMPLDVNSTLYLDRLLGDDKE